MNNSNIQYRGQQNQAKEFAGSEVWNGSQQEYK